MKAGQVTPGSIDFVIDLFQMYQDNVQWLIFNDDMLDFHIDVSCYYTMKLIKFEADYHSSVVWNALIEGWGVRDISFPDPMNYTGEPVTVYYWLNTSETLSVVSAARLNVSLLGDGELVGWGETLVPLGDHYDGYVSVAFLPTMYSRSSFELRYSIDIGGFHFAENRILEAPPW